MSRRSQAADDEDKRRQQRQRVVWEDEGEGVRRMPVVGKGIWKRSSLVELVSLVVGFLLCRPKSASPQSSMHSAGDYLVTQRSASI